MTRKENGTVNKRSKRYDENINHRTESNRFVFDKGVTIEIWEMKMCVCKKKKNKVIKVVEQEG